MKKMVEFKDLKDNTNDDDDDDEEETKQEQLLSPACSHWRSMHQSDCTLDGRQHPMSLSSSS
jgi:hypothetical protein